MKVITIYDSRNFKPNFSIVKDRYTSLYSDLATAICDLGQGSGIKQLPALLVGQKIIIVDGTTDNLDNKLPNLEAACELFGYGYVTFKRICNDLESFLGEEIFNTRYPSVISITNDESEGSEG